MHTPLDILVAVYPIEEGAEAALRQLLAAGKTGSVRVKAAVTLWKDASDRLHLVDRAPDSLLRGVGGMVVGVIAGPLGWQKLGGVSIGCLAERVHDGGLLDEVRKMGRSLPAGWSAIVAVIEHYGLREAKRLVNESIAGEVLEPDAGAAAAVSAPAA